MSWAAVGTAAVGVLGSSGGGGAGASPGVLDSGHVTHGNVVFGAQQKGINPWVIVAGVGVVVLGLVAWLVASGGRKSKG